MARYETRRWEFDQGAFGGRRSRQSFSYRAYVPDPIAERDFLLAPDIVHAVVDAEHATASLNVDPPVVANLEVVARRLLRAEAVASSRIEGLELSHRRLATAEAGGAEALDETARSVLGNIAAMEDAISFASTRAPLEAAVVLRLHERLMRATSTPQHAGRLRAEQNWIGGAASSPRDAEFIPPPHELVPALLDDLCVFGNRDDLPAIVQAAILHAHFETIHPFADGNGRVGRALIHVVLRRRGLATRYVPPISLVLAGNANAYVKGLASFRGGDVDDWCGLFAAACRTAANRASDLAGHLDRLREEWSARAGNPRPDSSAAALIALLPAHPVLSLATATALTGRSKQAVNDALAQLVEAGVVEQTTIGKRNRAFEAKELFELANTFERDLAESAAPSGERARPAPRRR